MKSVWAGIVMTVAFAASLGARPQAGKAGSMPSLGELARRLRAERKAPGAQPVKVFTNDNIPHHGGITVMGPAPEAAAPREDRSGRPQGERERRSEAAKDAFKREQPCPSTGKGYGPCPGYVIDHITPLACGGADAPSNMQWQTEAAAKAKDQWEREGCGKQRSDEPSGIQE